VTEPSTDRGDRGDRPWQVLGRRTIYDSQWIRLAHWSVRLPDGSVIPDHHVLDYPRAAVGIIPLGDDGRLLLIDHYRFITDTRGWEIPSGGIEAGESVEAAAARELMEETGHVAAGLARLGLYHPSNGSSNQTFHVMVAHGLREESPPLDVNETLGLRWFTPGEARALLLANQIRDGFTITSLLWAFLAEVVR
jgi:8-oxo-dGTP pyrophosphatase MutT (NUDIX family)